MTKQKTSITHGEAVIRQLHENPKFATEYLKAAMEETDDPKALLTALRRLAET